MYFFESYGNFDKRVRREMAKSRHDNFFNKGEDFPPNSQFNFDKKVDKKVKNKYFAASIISPDPSEVPMPSPILLMFSFSQT